MHRQPRADKLLYKGGANNSLYRGYTNDLDKRLEQHQSGKGAKYTRMHKPVKIVYSEQFDTKEEAMKRESYFKSAAGKKWLAEKLKAE